MRLLTALGLLSDQALNVIGDAMRAEQRQLDKAGTVHDIGPDHYARLAAVAGLKTSRSGSGEEANTVHLDESGVCPSRS